jgi:hypothetical protein
LLSFCCSCGQNFHQDCIQRWQKASHGYCPLCREPWRHASKTVAPGAPLPLPIATCVGRHGYINLVELAR